MNTAAGKNENASAVAERSVPTRIPAADILESPNGYTIVADVPGADETSLELSLDRNRLTVRAPVAEAAGGAGEAVYAEFAPKVFERTFLVGEGIDRDGISADLKNGVLTVSLPKSETVMPRTIAVKSD